MEQDLTHIIDTHLCRLAEKAPNDNEIQLYIRIAIEALEAIRTTWSYRRIEEAIYRQKLEAMDW